MLASGKPIITYFGLYSQSEWSIMLEYEFSLDAMNGLKVILDNRPGIAGVLLYNLQYDVRFYLLFIFI